jgi:hypothetical protein
MLGDPYDIWELTKSKCAQEIQAHEDKEFLQALTAAAKREERKLRKYSQRLLNVLKLRVGIPRPETDEELIYRTELEGYGYGNLNAIKKLELHTAVTPAVAASSLAKKLNEEFVGAVADEKTMQAIAQVGAAFIKDTMSKESTSSQIFKSIAIDEDTGTVEVQVFPPVDYIKFNIEV